MCGGTSCWFRELGTENRVGEQSNSRNGERCYICSQGSLMNGMIKDVLVDFGFSLRVAGFLNQSSKHIRPVGSISVVFVLVLTVPWLDIHG